MFTPQACFFSLTSPSCSPAGKSTADSTACYPQLFQKFAPAVHAVFGLCCFVICATMLAGIDSVFFEAFGIPKSVPVLSAAVLAAVFFICRKGIRRHRQGEFLCSCP